MKFRMKADIFFEADDAAAASLLISKHFQKVHDEFTSEDDASDNWGSGDVWFTGKFDLGPADSEEWKK